MAIKMFEILLNLSLVFVILKGFEACVNSDDDIARTSLGRPDVNCVALAQKLGKPWETLNVPHESDCRKFYGCLSHGGLVERRCNDANKTRFNPFANRCDWDREIECIVFDEYTELITSHNCE